MELPKPSQPYSSSYNYVYKPSYAVKGDDSIQGPFDSEEDVDDNDLRNTNSTAPGGTGKPSDAGQSLDWYNEDNSGFFEDVPSFVEVENDEEVPPFEDFARGKGLIFNDTEASKPSLAF